jgi:hypothetical protein
MSDMGPPQRIDEANVIMNDLRAFLETIAPGTISETTELERLLAASWHELDCREGGMEGCKLHGRMEDVSWTPPVLTFTIERHGGTVNGSSRAELQAWWVDVETVKANFASAGHRQLYPMSPRLDVRPLAEETTRLILAGQQDARLNWNADGSVRVLPGNIIPAEGAVKQTLAARRKRFRTTLKELLGRAGWSECKLNTYRREPLDQHSRQQSAAPA